MSRTFVIGDLHGCYDEFIELSSRIGIEDNDHLISLGDIVDRGSKSFELYQYFKSRPNAAVIMGNHEQKHLRGLLSYAQEIVKLQFADAYTDFVQWLSNLPYYYETDEAIIVHASFEHDVALCDQKKNVLIGSSSGSKYLAEKYGADTSWCDYYQGSKPIIYGHRVVGDKPRIRNNTYGIDTGACHRGYLTILELPDFKVHQIRVKDDYWQREREKWHLPVLKSREWEKLRIASIRKQIKILYRKDDFETRKFLKGMESWLDRVESTFHRIEVGLHKIDLELKEKYPSNYHEVASSLSYGNLLLRIGSGRLQSNYLRKILDTPQKVIELANQLGLSEIPFR